MLDTPARRPTVIDQLEVLDAVGSALAKLAFLMASIDTSDGKAVTRECLQQSLARVVGFMKARGLSESDCLYVQKLFEDAEGGIDAGHAPDRRVSERIEDTLGESR